MIFFFFFFNDTATTEIYTLSLHDALPIFVLDQVGLVRPGNVAAIHDHKPLPVDARSELQSLHDAPRHRRPQDRKSTRLNSSHANISYAVFCLKKKKTITNHILRLFPDYHL